MEQPDFTARLRQYWQHFLIGGPVGVGYAMRLVRIQRRLNRTRVYIDREKEVHAETLRTLHHQQNLLIGEQQAINVAAAQFRRYCDKQAEARS